MPDYSQQLCYVNACLDAAYGVYILAPDNTSHYYFLS
jgi:hypothetical protein